MSVVQWSPAFATGVREIDDQHKRLVDYINELQTPGGPGNGGVSRVLDSAIDYPLYHFAYEEALAVAKDNAANLDLDNRAAFLRTSWADGLGDEGFDLVVSNPPYIRSAEIETLDPEVRDHEPRLALDGGPDGLEAYRVLAPEVLRLLKPGGLFAIETGWDQGPQVKALFEAAGGQQVEIVRDLSDRERVVTGIKNPLGNMTATR